MSPDIELDEPLRQALYAHAEAEYPREACGLIVRSASGLVEYLQAVNTATRGDQFVLDPMFIAMAEDIGSNVLAIVHTHPDAGANPSMADRAGCERSGLPWVVVGWPNGAIKQLHPEGWLAPYKGREFHHGVLDCYTLVQDWYRRELAIELPDFDREDGWWEERPGHPAEDLYMQQFAKAGFIRVYGEPRRHDGILMQVLSDRANHAAVYLGDGTMLHHLHGRLSDSAVYGGYWLRHTVALVRHISRITPAEADSVALDGLRAAA